MKVMIKVGKIFERLEGLNPSRTTISSIGIVVTSLNQQISDDLRREILDYLPQESLAYKIASDANHFSSKQLWVIAYELQKNEKYVSNLEKEIADDAEYFAYQKARKAAKRAAKQDAKERTETAQLDLDLTQSDLPSTTDSLVKHGRFGIGKIVSENDTTITIHFFQHGEKTLLKRFTKLETFFKI
jgi:hypothetical protein